MRMEREAWRWWSVGGGGALWDVGGFNRSGGQGSCGC